MSENSRDPGSPDGQRTTGLFSSSTGVVVTVAAAGFLLLGAIVVCGGGLAVPIILRNQRQRNAAEAERSAVEKLKKYGQEAHERYGQEAMQTKQEAMRKSAEQEDSQEGNVLPDRGNKDDDSTERVEPK